MNLSDRIGNDFVYHAPSEEQVIKFQLIRDQAKAYAHLIDGLVPDGREKSLSLTKLEEAVMWANAGLARGSSTNV